MGELKKLQPHEQKTFIVLPVYKEGNFVAGLSRILSTLLILEEIWFSNKPYHQPTTIQEINIY